MAAQRSGQTRTTGYNRIRTITNLAVVGAVTGTAAMGVFVAHEYGGHSTTTTSTPSSSSAAVPQQSSGDDGSVQYQSPDDPTQPTPPAYNYAPAPSQAPPQSVSGGS